MPRRRWRSLPPIPTRIFNLVDDVRGAKSGAIAGEFTAGTALETMLAGTTLVAVRDRTSCALGVEVRRVPTTPFPTSSAPNLISTKRIYHDYETKKSSD